MSEGPKGAGGSFWWDNSLTLTSGGAFLLVLAGQALAGQPGFNEDLAADGLQQLTLGGYVMSSVFAVDVSENWQSEYLQFFLYIFGTVWLLQARLARVQGAPQGRTRKSDQERTPPGRQVAHRGRGLAWVRERAAYMYGYGL
ncbi:DUF6766 family protein [Streptomyces vinaceus]|uniref:DUF6766 family protein n=1 Tax=Streptomyces vinaceus TaxID=1960 RepID=UPI0019BA7A60|nr:DUF6766 family protein [Streptomyces vinaceus]GHE56515.1 hypothetical protein GCM10017778_45960 [Streptomyces vinaceus]